MNGYRCALEPSCATPSPSRPRRSPSPPPPKPGAPNVVVIVLDDVGFSRWVASAAPSPRRPSIAWRPTAFATTASTSRRCARRRACPAHRAQPPLQRHGVPRRAGRAASRATPVASRRRAASLPASLADARVRRRSPSASGTCRRDEEYRPPAPFDQLAPRPRLRAVLRLPRRRDRPVATRSWSHDNHPVGRPARPRTATT